MMSETLTPEDAEIQRLFGLSEQLRHELSARDSRIAALESQLAERDAEIERLKGLLVDATMEVGKGEMHMDTLEREHRAMATAITDLQSQLAAKDAMLAAATCYLYGTVYISKNGDGRWTVYDARRLACLAPGHTEPGGSYIAIKFDTPHEAYQAAQAAGWLSQEAKGEEA